MGLLVLTTISVLFYAYTFLRPRRASNLPLPPGPPDEPILGHLWIVPTDSPEYAYIQWGEEYKSDVL